MEDAVHFACGSDGANPGILKERKIAMNKARDFDTWVADVARELTTLGVDSMEAKRVPYENEKWFRAAFEDGLDAAVAAAEWFNYD